MRVIDDGHLYSVPTLDGEGEVEIRFVKRVGPKYPGNKSPAYPGCISQDVIRVLIDRLRYVHRQEAWQHNEQAIECLRRALVLLEERAAQARGVDPPILPCDAPELATRCRGCGHTFCEGGCGR